MHRIKAQEALRLIRRCILEFDEREIFILVIRVLGTLGGGVGEVGVGRAVDVRVEEG